MLCIGTSAWNGLIRGRKRWVLFPPDADEALVKGLDFSSSRMEAQDTTTWFEQVLPRILAREREAVHAENQEKKANKQAYQQCCDPTCAYAYSNASESDSTSQQNQLKTDLNTGATASTRPSACSHSLPRHRTGIIEFIQYPGEIVFIPGGWWHAVINLDDTVAITENFITETNFDRGGAWARRYVYVSGICLRANISHPQLYCRHYESCSCAPRFIHPFIYLCIFACMHNCVGWRLWRKYYPHSTKLWRDLLDKHHPSQGRRARELDEEDGVDVEALYGKKGERRGRRNNDW